MSNQRTINCLKALRDLRYQLELKDSKLPTLSKWKLHIVSENNFPTAAGLASSAAGFAAFVVAIAKLYQLPQSMSELSKIARQGSGSACRSLFGGFVAWEMGQLEDGSDSMAVPVNELNDWSSMKAIILVVSDSKKDTSSTMGMQLTVKTSDLFQERVKTVVPKRFVQMKEAIINKDFATFAELTMKDSNSFHATCLDSFPPIFYMNDTSRKIIKLCHKINEYYGESVVAYTFDAGPNAVLYYLEENENKLLPFIYKSFNQVPGWDSKYTSNDLQDFLKNFQESILPKFAEHNELDEEVHKGVSRVILSRVGAGPQSTDKCLIDSSTGLPK
ncbi:diphosphomevalonate decarboxylase MVD1 NDAI_0K02340 [Naumovozyma dairenensis CBS 421]|uniref:Diphosphomevalonate decarboxylase n=1 Tax=Naumovozyma dairenensis (strain ATCC 10597 / BCRC 20456 / CBS 421 / NBRC 0211 / NRRL Y-12639) TaxID=1071378 RepID=G0WI14_NAUDC|nr:hypothetical protein NDAI_0K02340 [Naumovozyma dairenensis CBS 421]CCD27425.1 hypothetical protein NDAI_0K02340 [Naumovozyma dairenensis CBS 421]